MSSLRYTPESRDEAVRQVVDRELFEVPAMALVSVRFEIGHMGEFISDMLSSIETVWSNRDREALDQVLTPTTRSTSCTRRSSNTSATCVAMS